MKRLIRIIRRRLIKLIAPSLLRERDNLLNLLRFEKGAHAACRAELRATQHRLEEVSRQNETMKRSVVAKEWVLLCDQVTQEFMHKLAYDTAQRKETPDLARLYDRMREFGIPKNLEDRFMHRCYARVLSVFFGELLSGADVMFLREPFKKNRSTFTMTTKPNRYYITLDDRDFEGPTYKS